LPLVCFGAVLLLVSLASAARAEDPASAAPPAAEAPSAAPAPVAAPTLVVPPGAPVAAPDAQAPALVRAPDAAKPARVPLAKKWWFWTSIGGAAVAVVLVGLFLGPPKPYSGNANPGLEQVF
jgi:hypothetical protein